MLLFVFGFTFACVSCYPKSPCGGKAIVVSKTKVKKKASPFPCFSFYASEAVALKMQGAAKAAGKSG